MTAAPLYSGHMLSSSQLAKRLGKSKKTIDRMIRDGRLPEPNRFEANGWRYWTLQDATEIEALLEKGRDDV